jgi:hypothetical protein
LEKTDPETMVVADPAAIIDLQEKAGLLSTTIM